MPPVIRVLPDKEQICREAAEQFVRLARAAIAARGRFLVALSGGSTPRRLYELLADEPARGQVDWSKVQFFWGDERCVPPDDPQSNYRMAHEAMLAKLPLAADQVHRMPAERPDRDAAARDYQAEIARVFGADSNSPPPPFDLIHLGMGPEGHTASLFPHTPALNETGRWVVAQYVPKVQMDRMTFTPPMLNAGSHVTFLIAGSEKADALAHVLEGLPEPDEYPAQLVRPRGELLFLIDNAAAAKLKGASEKYR